MGGQLEHLGKFFRNIAPHIALRKLRNVISGFNYRGNR